jgi:hypothetical protein
VDYGFRAVPTSTHLHVIGAGQNTRETARRFLADTHRSVSEHQATAVLLEMNFAGPSLDLGSLYAILFENRLEASLLRRVAYVDVSSRQHLPERAEFVELAANKLGINGRVFESVADAERWLASKD